MDYVPALNKNGKLSQKKIKDSMKRHQARMDDERDEKIRTIVEFLVLAAVAIFCWFLVFVLASNFAHAQTGGGGSWGGYDASQVFDNNSFGTDPFGYPYATMTNDYGTVSLTHDNFVQFTYGTSTQICNVQIYACGVNAKNTIVKMTVEDTIGGHILTTGYGVTSVYCPTGVPSVSDQVSIALSPCVTLNSSSAWFGTTAHSAYGLNVNYLIATSTFSGAYTADYNDYPLAVQLLGINSDSFFRQSASSTTILGCNGFTTGTIENGLCNIAAFLFVPNQQSLERFTSLKDQLVNDKAPFGYFAESVNAIGGVTSTATTTDLNYTVSTTLGSFVLFDASSTKNSAIWTDVTPLIFFWFRVFMWGAFLFWIYERIKHIEL